MPAVPQTEPSFAEAVKTLSPLLARYLGRMVADNAIAEDLLQETLIRLARGLPDFDRRSSLKSWSFAIATRVALDHFRHNKAVPRGVDVGEAAELPSVAPTPEDRLALDQMNACVRQVVESLPQEYRDAILLHDLGGFSASETAESCGCSTANAKVRIHRARARLREALTQQCELYRDGDNVLRCHRRD